MLCLFIKLFLLFINSISLNALFGYDVNNCESHNKQFSDVSVCGPVQVPFFPSLGVYNSIEYSNIYSYFHDHYNTDYYFSYTILSNGKLSGLSTSAYSDGYGQYEDSVYIASKNGCSYSEGNCGLTSTSNALAYYSRYGGKSNLPAYNSTVSFSAYSEPAIMSAAAEMDYYPKATSSTLHELYLKEREYAINCGYVVMGTSVNTMEYAFENAGQYYGYNNTSYTYHSESNTTKSFIINEIDNNRPVQLVTVGDAFYGNHAMMITGYRELYSLIHTSTYSYDISVFFVSVLDGHSSSERWFDIQSLSSFPHVANQYRYSYVYSAQLIVG